MEANAVSHEKFLELIANAFPDKTELANMHAVLKRSVAMFNTERFLCYRKAGEDKHDVPRTAYPGGKLDFIEDSSKHKIAAWTDGDRTLPRYFEAGITWEDAWLKEASRKHKGKSGAPAETPAAKVNK